MPTPRKRRTTITIDDDLHDESCRRARNVHHTDFSGLITKLLVDDLHNGPLDLTQTEAKVISEAKAVEAAAAVFHKKKKRTNE